MEQSTKIKYVSYSHLQEKPKDGIKAFEKWEKEQKEKYKSSPKSLKKKIIDLSSNLKIPFSGTETESMIEEIIDYSGIPILSYVKSTKNLKDRILLYLGAGNDVEHASLFMANTNFFIDKNYNNKRYIEKVFLDYFKGYNIDKEFSKNISKLRLELNGNSKDIILIKEDIWNHDSIYNIIKEEGYEKISFLINKKTSSQEASLPFLDNLEENGLFLQSDCKVFKELKDFKELWYGVLGSYRLQSGGEFEIYPAKLFQKINH